MAEKQANPSKDLAHRIEEPKQVVDYGKWQCPVCGSSVYIWNQARHRRTKKHKDSNYILTEIFEMI